MKEEIDDIPVTRRSRAVAGSCLRVVECPAGVLLEHRLEVPSGLCPVSTNPQEGTVVFRYTSRGASLEVVTLHRFVQDGGGGAVRSVEELASHFAGHCYSAVGPCRVELDLLLLPGPQRLRVTVDK